MRQRVGQWMWIGALYAMVASCSLVETARADTMTVTVAGATVAAP